MYSQTCVKLANFPQMCADSHHAPLLFQDTLDYGKMSRTITLQTNVAGNWPGLSLRGLCAVKDYLITVEGDFRQGTRFLCLYEVTPEKLVFLYKSAKVDGAFFPRADSEGAIYVPHASGVSVVRVENSKLRILRTLTAGGWLKYAHGVAVVRKDTILVTVGGDRQNLYLVDVQSDTATLVQTEHLLAGKEPFGVATLSGSVLLGYQESSILFLIPPGAGSPSPIHPQGLKSIRGITADKSGCFLVADEDSSGIWILSTTGETSHVIDVGKSSRPYDLTLVTDKRHQRVYIADLRGEIFVVSRT